MASETKDTALPPEPKDWQKKEGFGRFARDVVIAAVVLGGGLFFYRSKVETGKQVHELGKQARDELFKDMPASYAKAEELLQKAVALDGKNPYAVSALAEVYAIRWQDLGQEEYAAKAREFTERAGKIEANIVERFDAEVLTRLADKKYPEAESYGAEIVKKAATGRVVDGLARALRANGKLAEARQAFKKSADTEWRNPRLQDDFGDAYFEDGDYYNAEGFYAKGIEANPDHVRSLIGRSRAQIARGQHIKDAEDTLTAVLANEGALVPKLKAQALTAQAELRLFEKKADEALKLANDAAAAFPSYAWAYFAMGKAQAMKQDAPGANASFDKALAADPYVPEFYYGAAAALMEAGDSAAALAKLDAYTGKMKEDDRLHLTYGQMLKKLGKTDEALAKYEAALKLNNFNAQAHFAKGTLLLEDKKDLDNAEKELAIALQVQEIYPDAEQAMGNLWFARNEYQKGLETYAQSLVHMKMMQTPREKMNDVRDAVAATLKKAGKKKDVVQYWMDESAKLIR